MISKETRQYPRASYVFTFDTDIEASHWSHFDETQVRQDLWTPGKGDVVLDCGAAYGSYALLALAYGAEHVVAWAPENHAPLLRQSLKENNWSHKATVLESGLWSEPGYLRFEKPGAFAVFSKEAPPASLHTFSVSTVDSVVDLLGLSRVDWMKLDVEGAEVRVLQGAAKTIEQCRPKIFVEHHLFMDGTIRQQIADMLSKQGYVEQENRPHGVVSHSLFVPR